MEEEHRAPGAIVKQDDELTGVEEAKITYEWVKRAAEEGVIVEGVETLTARGISSVWKSAKRNELIPEGWTDDESFAALGFWCGFASGHTFCDAFHKERLINFLNDTLGFGDEDLQKVDEIVEEMKKRLGKDLEDLGDATIIKGHIKDGEVVFEDVETISFDLPEEEEDDD